MARQNRGLAPLVVGLITVLCCPASAQRSEADYRLLTNTFRSFTNFNVEVVRGFVVEGKGPDFNLFALNAYESTLVHHTDTSGEPAQRWRTLTNPVSIAAHNSGLYVVGQGNHALARHDRVSGQITEILALRSEPADIVIDGANGWAWISCMGDDSVVQVDVNATPMRILKVWNKADGLELKRPCFLYLDSDSSLLVAPMVSGNNTIVDAGADVPVIDGNDPAYCPPPPSGPAWGGLPDFDIFRIRAAAGTVEPVLRQVGSLVMAHGRHPSGDYWVVSIDEKNVEPGMLNEPALRGLFAENRLSITPQAVFDGSSAPDFAQPSLHIDLDDLTPQLPGPTYTPQTSVSFPYAMDFDQGASGLTAVAGSTSPLVLLLDAGGARMNELELNDSANSHQGLVARTLRFHQDKLYVYCQQSSNILLFDLTPAVNPDPSASLSLGNDPTPAPVAAGRATWYDGTRSADGRTSCNVCHPAGREDGLVWQISNEPVDEKGALFTQNLRGIEDSFPYHWRGERDLAAFNGAFPGLLGSDAPLDPDNGELDAFLEFIFSLNSPANPKQVGEASLDGSGRLIHDYDRRLKDSLATQVLGEGLTQNPTTGAVVEGDRLFHEVPIPTLGERTCEQCHQNPTGTNGEVVDDAADIIASKSNMKVAHLDNELPLKDQPIVDVWIDLDGPGNSLVANFRPSNLIGAGTAHNGQRTNLFAFNQRFVGLVGQQGVFDLTAFLNFFDAGTAPAVHYAAQLNQASPPGTADNIQKWLLDQAAKSWVGCCAIGTFQLQGGEVRMNFYYDASTGLFVSEDGSFARPQPFNRFIVLASAGVADIIFLGTPPGNERRLGADFDDDGLDTQAEDANGTDKWNPDTDGDGFLDGYEVANGENPLVSNGTVDDQQPPALVGAVTRDFVNGSQAKFFFETDEPCRWEIEVSTPGGKAIVDSRDSFDTRHTALVHKLEPSTEDLGMGPVATNTFMGELRIFDFAGNMTVQALTPFDSGTMLHDGTFRLLTMGELKLASEVRTPASYLGRAKARVDFREGSPASTTPAPDRVIVAQLLKQRPDASGTLPTMDWDIIPASDFQADAPSLSFEFSKPSNNPPVWKTYDALPGPFLVLDPTNANGVMRVSYLVTNPDFPNQKVKLNILAVIELPSQAQQQTYGFTYDPNAPRFVLSSLTDYQLATTAPEKRCVVGTK